MLQYSASNFANPPLWTSLWRFGNGSIDLKKDLKISPIKNLVDFYRLWPWGYQFSWLKGRLTQRFDKSLQIVRWTATEQYRTKKMNISDTHFRSRYLIQVGSQGIIISKDQFYDKSMYTLLWRFVLFVWIPVGVISTLYDVCSVHRGMFSTLGDIMMHVGGYQEYIEGCSVHRGFQYV